MDPRTTKRVSLRLAEHFARDRRGVSLTKSQELQQIDDGVAFGPSEVRVGDLTGPVADVQKERGNCIGYRRTGRAKHVVPADIGAGHFERAGKIRYVSGSDL